MTRRLMRFVCDEHGAVNVEFVLWIPIIIALLTTAIDASALYITHTEMWNVARDTARRMVTGKFLTEAEAEAYAFDAMSLRELPYTVQATYDPNGVVEMIIQVSFADLSIIQYGSPLMIFGRNIEARVVMRPDPRIPFQAGT